MVPSSRTPFLTSLSSMTSVDHSPDDGVEQAQAGVSDGVEAEVDPAAFRMQDEADQVDDGAEQGTGNGGLLLADLGSQHGGQRGHNDQRSDGRAHGHSRLGSGVLEVIGEDVGVHAGHGEHGQQQAQGRQDDAQQGAAGENALEQDHGLELLRSLAGISTRSVVRLKQRM